jgi:hypothetical protein
MGNCDEFIFYDDLVREQKARRTVRKKTVAAGPATATAATDGKDKDKDKDKDKEKEREKDEDKQQEAFDLVLATIDALISERGEDEKVWGSMVKQALKRRRPGFNESYYGFRSFNGLLEEAATRRLLTLERDEKSGGYIIHTNADT